MSSTRTENDSSNIRRACGRAGGRVGGRACRPASEGASKPASRQASKPASRQASKPASHGEGADRMVQLSAELTSVSHVLVFRLCRVTWPCPPVVGGISGAHPWSLPAQRGRLDHLSLSLYLYLSHSLSFSLSLYIYIYIYIYI